MKSLIYVFAFLAPIVDFGKGVEVPFIVLKDDNRAKERIDVDERTYRLLKSKRQARLFFDTRNLTRSGSMHSARTGK